MWRGWGRGKKDGKEKWRMRGKRGRMGAKWKRDGGEDVEEEAHNRGNVEEVECGGEGGGFRGGRETNCLTFVGLGMA